MHKFAITIIIIGLFVITGNLYAEEKTTYYQPKGKGFNTPFGKGFDYKNILVKSIVDGDTIVLETGQKVRLIGIDTPEMHNSEKLERDAKRSGTDVATIKELGLKAQEFTKKMIEGKIVRIEYDVEKFDKYNRILAYVFLPDDTFVNAEIVRQGYASLMTIPPNIKYAEMFLNAYREAQSAGRGLWQYDDFGR